jgi:hypothetical protein
VSFRCFCRLRPWLYTEASLHHLGIGRVIPGYSVGRDETIVLEIDCAQKTITGSGGWILHCRGTILSESSGRLGKSTGYAHECASASPTRAAESGCSRDALQRDQTQALAQRASSFTRRVTQGPRSRLQPWPPLTPARYPTAKTHRLADDQVFNNAWWL